MYSKYTSNFVLWKTFSILNIMQIYPNIKNILIVSDLYHDFNSVYKIKAIYPHIYIKTYKFIEKPTVCKLIKQQYDFSRFINFIINDKKLDNYKFYI